MTDFIEVSSLKRQCQYVDEKFIKCGRLAEVEIGDGVVTYAPLRCREHSIWVSPERTSYSYSSVHNGAYFGLGF